MERRAVMWVLGASLLCATSCKREPGAAATVSSAARASDERLERAFSLKNAEPMPKARRGDWLADHPEPGQTFEQYAASAPNKPTAARGVLYLLPLGQLGRAPSPAPELLRRYAQSFFGLPAKLLPPLDETLVAARARVHPHLKKRQLHAPTVLSGLQKLLPKDGYGLIALTLTDLYPEPSWNFVFGMASLQERVGVQSLARYDPAFFGERHDAKTPRLVLERSLKVLTHELGHMFGIAHCTAYRCLLNGANHQAESDSQPLHPCPVCLRKLHHAVGFGVRERYRTLSAFYEDVGLRDEARWTAARQHELEGPYSASISP